jgi:glycosyltransferase involved in cell wall biosynthesis
MDRNNRRVVFVSQRYPPEQGGNASRIRDTAVNLSEQGWDVTVLAPVKSYPFGEFERSRAWHTRESEREIAVHRFWTWQPQTTGPSLVHRLAYFLVFALQALWWLLRNVRRYDIVITSSPPITTELSGIAVSLLGKPWVTDIRDLWIDAAVGLGHIEEGGLPERAARRFQRFALRTADKITVTTDATTEELEASYGPGIKSKTVLIPNGVDADVFVASDDDVGETGSTDSSAAGQPVIVYTGNIGSAQDLESCVKAMDRLADEDAVLRLVGSGDLIPELKRLVDELSLADRVEFTGLVPRETVPKILNEATVGVAPLKDTAALKYAMPTKVYEYLACGLPTLVTGGDHIEWFIRESGGGVHVDNDPERIAEALDELLADANYRTELAERGHDHVVAQYTREGIARRLSDELGALVDTDDAGTSTAPRARTETA